MRIRKERNCRVHAKFFDSTAKFDNPFPGVSKLRQYLRNGDLPSCHVGNPDRKHLTNPEDLLLAVIRLFAGTAWIGENLDLTLDEIYDPVFGDRGSRIDPLL